MRDIVLFGFIFSLLPVAAMHPWVGAMLWAWVSIMNPHKLAWGAAFDFPFAYVIALATLVGLVVTRDKRSITFNTPLLLLTAFIFWMCVTSVFALYPQPTWEMFTKVMKIQAMLFVTLYVLHSKKHVITLVTILVVSLGYYGVKGGVFTIRTGGSEKVWGPPGGFIGGNNEIALALVIIIPLAYFLYQIDTLKWRRLLVLVSIMLTALAALGTQSRGALLAVFAMGFVLWTRSQKKLLALCIVAFLGVALIAMMPESWEERMRTIQNYQQDGSAMGRINAWIMAFNLATDRWIGGGFEVITPELFARYAPNPLDLHAAHSIYFQVLGEHGFVGLFLFLAIWVATWRMAGRLRVEARGHSEHAWIATLGGMIQVSLAGYLVGGAFLSLAYFDLPYYLIALVTICKSILGSEVRTQPASGMVPMSQWPTSPSPRIRFGDKP